VNGVGATAAALAAGSYLSLTTFRRDGTPVATPVWVVGDGDRLVVWTAASSWKVRRIRRNPAVTVAPCTFRGRLTGTPVSGRASVLPADQTSRIKDLIKKKYRLLGPLTLWSSRRRSGGVERSVALSIELRPDASRT
jgi:PPOX class probable F420-dependent enzyme